MVQNLVSLPNRLGQRGCFIDPTDRDISRSDISGGRLGGPIVKRVMQPVLGD